MTSLSNGVSTTRMIYTLVSIKKLQAVHSARHLGAKLERAATSQASDPAEASPGEEARDALLSAVAAEAAEEE